MRVELDNGIRFTTNLRYNIKSDISADPVKDGAEKFSQIKAGSYESFESKCGQTMVGFVQHMHGVGSLEKHTVQCFAGKQTKHFDIEHSTEQIDGEGVKLAVIDGSEAAKIMNSISFVGTGDDIQASDAQSPPDETNLFLRESHKRKSHKRYNAHHTHVANDDNDKLIEMINELNLGWKADTCKYQKHHEKYGSHCEAQILAQTGSKGEEQADN
jgi:hypothetical protein